MRANRQTDRQTICIEQDVSTTSKLHISSYRAFRCFIPSTCCCCSFSSSSGSVGGEVILQCWKGFLSLVGDFEMWCVCKRYLFAQRKSVELRGVQPFHLVCLWNGESARALSFSLSLCMWAETSLYFEINQTRDSCSACSCSRLAICSTPR